MADRISTLPDAVLCYLLSFLPTEDVVATSVLSKRWTNLWRSVPALDFTYLGHTSASLNFDGIVYSVMLFRDAVTPIQRFSLNIESNYYRFYNINKWVKFVLQSRVEHLNLDVTCDYEMPNLPIDIFTCRTLVVLKLCGFSFTQFSSVTLPSVKTLRLEYIRFPEYLYIMEILAGCPILEDLALYSITIDSDDPSSSYGEFKSLRLTKLTTAGIDSDIHIPLRALYNAEKLIIEIKEMNHCFSFEEIPTFHNLTNLELNFIKYNWNLIVEMLKHCPKLRNLVLEETNMDKGEHRRKGEERKGGQENWVDPDIVPECFSLHLRTCTLRNYEGLQGELLFARYIIKNAEVLQSMTVYTTRYSRKNKRRYEMMKRKLSWCPRSSATCEVDFQFSYNE